MGVNLVIEDVPDDVAERLRQRALRREHSLEDELLDIIVGAVVDEDVPSITLAELVAEIRARGRPSPDESTAMIREDRDRAGGRH